MYSEAFLKVLRRSLTFWDVLSHFDAFSWVETFSDVLGCSGGFGDVLMSFERLQSHSDTFLWVLSSSERFLYVLNNSLNLWGFCEAFRGILIGFLNVFEGFDVFSDALECSQVLLCVIVCTKQFRKGPESSAVIYDLLGCSKAVRGVFLCSEHIQTSHEGCKTLSDLLEYFENF